METHPQQHQQHQQHQRQWPAHPISVQGRLRAGLRSALLGRDAAFHFQTGGYSAREWLRIEDEMSDEDMQWRHGPLLPLTMLIACGHSNMLRSGTAEALGLLHTSRRLTPGRRHPEHYPWMCAVNMALSCGHTGVVEWIMQDASAYGDAVRVGGEDAEEHDTDQAQHTYAEFDSIAGPGIKRIEPPRRLCAKQELAKELVMGVGGVNMVITGACLCALSGAIQTGCCELAHSLCEETEQRCKSRPHAERAIAARLYLCAEVAAGRIDRVMHPDGLQEKFYDSATALLLASAASSGSLELLEWLSVQGAIEAVSHRSDVFSAMAECAARAGHLHVLEWMHARPKQFRDCFSAVTSTANAAFTTATRQGHANIMRWFLSRGVEPVRIDMAALDAVSCGHVDILRMLTDAVPRLGDAFATHLTDMVFNEYIEALSRASPATAKEVACLLFDLNITSATAEACVAAACCENVRPDYLAFLAYHATDRVWSNALDDHEVILYRGRTELLERAMRDAERSGRAPFRRHDL